MNPKQEKQKSEQRSEWKSTRHFWLAPQQEESSLEQYSSNLDWFTYEFSDHLDEEGNITLGKRGRQENGLVTLTLRFISLLKTAPDQTLDLNEAVKRLEVQKRRIYDITNVLEGINLIKKAGKNHIKWNSQVNTKNKSRPISSASNDSDVVEELNYLNPQIRS